MQRASSSYICLICWPNGGVVVVGNYHGANLIGANAVVQLGRGGRIVGSRPGTSRRM